MYYVHVTGIQCIMYDVLYVYSYVYVHVVYVVIITTICTIYYTQYSMYVFCRPNFEKALAYIDTALKYVRSKSELANLYSHKLVIENQPEIDAELKTVGLEFGNRTTVQS